MSPWRWTGYPPWCYRLLQPHRSSLWSAPLGWCPGSTAPPGSHWTFGAPVLSPPAEILAGLEQETHRIKMLDFLYSVIRSVQFSRFVKHSLACVSLSLNHSDVRGGSFLGTAPGSKELSFSITTPLSVVPFDTAESPQPRSLLPLSSWQHTDMLWKFKKICTASQTWRCHGGIFVLTHCHEHSSSGTTLKHGR